MANFWTTPLYNNYLLLKKDSIDLGWLEKDYLLPTSIALVPLRNIYSDKHELFFIATDQKEKSYRSNCEVWVMKFKSRPEKVENYKLQFLELILSIDYFFEEDSGFKVVGVGGCKSSYFYENDIAIEGDILGLEVANDGKESSSKL